MNSHRHFNYLAMTSAIAVFARCAPALADYCMVEATQHIASPTGPESTGFAAALEISGDTIIAGDQTEATIGPLTGALPCACAHSVVIWFWNFFWSYAQHCRSYAENEIRENVFDNLVSGAQNMWLTVAAIASSDCVHLWSGHTAKGSFSNVVETG